MQSAGLPTIQQSNFEQAEQLMAVVSKLVDLKNKPLFSMVETNLWVLLETNNKHTREYIFAPILGWYQERNSITPVFLFSDYVAGRTFLTFCGDEKLDEVLNINSRVLDREDDTKINIIRYLPTKHLKKEFMRTVSKSYELQDVQKETSTINVCLVGTSEEEFCVEVGNYQEEDEDGNVLGFKRYCNIGFAESLTPEQLIDSITFHFDYEFKI